MTLTSIAYRTKEQDGKRYEGTTFILGEHYTVERYITRYENGNVYKRYSVNVRRDDRHENYIPEIYYWDDIFGEEKPRFEIQTTSYGALSPEEIKKVIAGYNEAVEAVEILTKNFC